MIESGSHEPVDVSAWRLPEGTALRYERPAAHLRSLFAGYAILDSDPSTYRGGDSWLLPGQAMLWAALTAPKLSMKSRGARAAEVGSAMLIGPSSITIPVEAHGGVSIAVELKPRGWARLFDIPAADMRDRIVSLGELLPATWVVGFLTGLHACDRGSEVKQVLDAFFDKHLPPPTKQEDLIARIERLIVSEGGRDDVSFWHERVGLGSPRTLARACERYFGFGPKVLQRRHRFLRIFASMLIAKDPVDFRKIPPGYHDVPRFLRDARHFLGMTAKQFVDMPMVYLRAALRARLAVIGSPLPLLDHPEPTHAGLNRSRSYPAP